MNSFSLNSEFLDDPLKQDAKSRLYSAARFPKRKQEESSLLDVQVSNRSCFILSPAHSFVSAVPSDGSRRSPPGAQNIWPRSKDFYKLETIIGKRVNRAPIYLNYSAVLRKKKKCGVGDSAIVYLASCISRPEKCAVKLVDLKNWKYPLEDLMKDVYTISNLAHENITECYMSFVDDQELLLVLPLMEQRSIYDVIQRKKSFFNCNRGVFDEPTIATIISAVLNGLEYLHSNNFIHRDMRAENILLGSDGSVKIAEFAVKNATARYHRVIGSACWLPPEKIENPSSNYETKSDIWSLGITTIELVTGSPPHSKESPSDVLLLIYLNEPPTLDSVAVLQDQYIAYGHFIRSFIADCLKKNPSERPGSTNLMFHPFFKKAKDKDFLQSVLAKIPPCEEYLFEKSTLIRTPWRRMKRKKWVLPLIQNEQSTKQDEEIMALQHSSYSMQTDFPWTKSSIDSNSLYKMALRIRGLHFNAPMIVNSHLYDKRSLYDIGFQFLDGCDTAKSVATELVREGFINMSDKPCIVKNLSKLLDDTSLGVVTFPLNSSIPSTEAPSKWNFIGYASLRILVDETLNEEEEENK